MVSVVGNCETEVISYFRLSLPLKYWKSYLSCQLLWVFGKQMEVFS